MARAGVATVATERPPPVAIAVTERPRASGRARWRPWAGRIGRHVGAVGLFCLPAIVLWWHVWDGHLASSLTCACGDAGQTVWFTAWPAYALAHGLDPFFSRALQAPYGVNLLDNASAVPVGLALTPLTWVAGPVVSANVALTLCPALGAWGCWVAARRLVGWRVAAAAAGLLYGYSPFVLDNVVLGHVSMALLVVPPLLVVAVREVLVGPAAARGRWGAAAGALVALQFLLSPEVLAIVVVAGAPASVVAWVAAGSRRPSAGQLLGAIGAGAGVGAVLLAAPVWFFLSGAQHLSGPLWSSAGIEGGSVSGLWDPGFYRAAATTLQQLGGYDGRRGPPVGYLGPVTVALVVLSIAVAWRRKAVQALVVAGGVALVCSFGIVLFSSPGHVLGSWMPWRLVAGWPLLDDVVPQRFALVLDLCAALVVGIGIDRARSLLTAARKSAMRRRAGPALLAVLALGASLSTFRTVEVPFATRSIDVPVWFRYQAPQLRPSTVLLTYPFPYPADGDSGPMVWQAVDGMRFELAGGYVKAPAADGRPLMADPGRQPYAFLAALSNAAAGPLPRLTPDLAASLRAALRRWHVDEVVVTDRGREPERAVRTFTTVLGRRPSAQEGAWVWDVGPSPASAANASPGAPSSPQGTVPAQSRHPA